MLLFSVILAGLAMAACGHHENPPNLLILTLDTTRADHLGCYGYENAHTPNLDAFAQDRAVRFDNAITSVALTLPSHATIMTGTYPVFHGIHDNNGFILDEEVTTLAEILSDEGYATGAVLASYPLSSEFNLDQGFDHYNDDFQEDWRESEIAARGDRSFGFVERTADRVNQAAKRWLDKHDQEPFFLWVHHFDPHQAYSPPAPYDSQFASAPYDGEIAFTDEYFGRLLGDLEQRGLLDNTVIVVVGDHGEGLGDHGEPTHAAFVFDSTVRVPLLISSPAAGLAAGGVVDHQVGTVDITPTVLELLGVEPHSDIQGQSLVSDLLNPGSGQSLPVLVETHFCQYHLGWAPLRALRTDQWKVVLGPKPELYNLEQDPGETHNLAAVEPDKLAEMTESLQTFVREHTSPVWDRSIATALDPSVRANLEALGYLGGGGKSERAEPFPDPDELSRMPNPLDHPRALILANASSEALRTERFDQALLLSRRGLEVDPGNFMLHIDKARAMIGLDLLEQAIPILDIAAEAKPSDALPFALLGHCFLRLERFDEARESYEVAVGLERNRAEYHEQLGTVRAGTGDYEGAVEALEEALRLDNHRWSAHLRLGIALSDTGRMEEARSSFQKALERNPYSPVVLQQIGLFYLKLGETDFAFRSLAQAAERVPDDLQLLLQLTQADSLRGASPDEIRTRLDRIVQIAPDSPEAAAARQWLERLDEGQQPLGESPPDTPVTQRSELKHFHVEG